ncbi:cell envelope integrity protein TolA [Yokenella regensburgei]|uniref:cell envelope integrity protein TolA n=1 Tax=Yokenella regensburgei TaxID=158877 RepID=UPI003F180583
MLTTIFTRSDYTCAGLFFIATLLLSGCTKVNSHPRNEADDIITGMSAQDSNAELIKYLSQIHRAVTQQMVDVDDREGKTCSLHIKLNPDGSLKDVQAISGDPGLCPVLISAMKHAQLPAPPSTEVYEQIKVATLDFKL